MKTTNNGLFVHQLKKELKLVIVVRKPLLGEQRWTTPALENLSFSKIFSFSTFQEPKQSKQTENFIV